MKHLVCAACGTTNRLPETRLDEHPVCGRCRAELMPGKPLALGDANLERFIAGTEVPVLVDFWAEWCGPCRAMAPQFEQAATLLPGVQLVKVETDANPQAGTRHRIRSIPTLVLFNGGHEVARRSGAMGASELARWVRSEVAAVG